MKTLIQRLSEPSTYAGLSAMAIAIGIPLEDFQQWAAGLAGVFATIAIVLGEKKA